MFNHIGLRTPDLKRSSAFYAAALQPLGHVVGSDDGATVGLGPAGEPQLWLHAAPRAEGSTHLAFEAASREVVDAFYAAAVAAGGRDNGAPGIRADFGPTYYAAFVLDPDGNNAEAVCLG